MQKFFNFLLLSLFLVASLALAAGDDEPRICRKTEAYWIDRAEGMIANARAYGKDAEHLMSIVKLVKTEIMLEVESRGGKKPSELDYAGWYELMKLRAGVTSHRFDGMEDTIRKDPDTRPATKVEESLPPLPDPSSFAMEESDDDTDMNISEQESEEKSSYRIPKPTTKFDCEKSAARAKGEIKKPLFLACPTCMQKFISGYRYERHLSIHLGKYYRCPATECKARGSFKKEMVNHMVYKHCQIDSSNPRVLRCQIPACSSPIVWEGDIHSHMDEHLGD